MEFRCDALLKLLLPDVVKPRRDVAISLRLALIRRRRIGAAAISGIPAKRVIFDVTEK
jgi:hypothetical protein